jgi:hypothetical protein
MMSDHESPGPSRVLTTPDPLTRPTQRLDRDAPETDHSETQSPAMRELFAKAQRVARTELPILLTGEIGVGKEWLARWIHAHSPRASRTFVPVNCAAIPDTLLDSYLFGHTSGAFTGAVHESLECSKPPREGRCSSITSAALRPPCRSSCSRRLRRSKYSECESGGFRHRQRRYNGMRALSRLRRVIAGPMESEQ